MRKIIFYFLLLFVLGEIISLFLINKSDNSRVLSESVVSTPTVLLTPTPTMTPSPTPEATPTIKPTPKPTPIKTPTPSPTPIPQPTFTSEQINEFINRFASQYSVSPDVLRYIALCESGFNPLAQHLSYAGLYQFGPNTWISIRTKMGEDTSINLRLNAEEAVQTAAYNLHINNAGIWPNCVP